MSSKSISIRIAVAVLVVASAAACGSSSSTSQPSPVVTSVTASIAPGQSGTGGPFDFTGTITATGATAVSYRWELSNGTVQETQALQFGGPGSLTTTYKFAPGLICIGDDQVLWARLTVLEPNVMESTTVSFTRNCILLHPHI
jgi:hypothetical protein